MGKLIDPKIDWTSDHCKRCATCVSLCPVRNLELKADEIISLGRCNQCRLCMGYCPDFAIEVEPKGP